MQNLPTPKPTKVHALNLVLFLPNCYSHADLVPPPHQLRVGVSDTAIDDFHWNAWPPTAMAVSSRRGLAAAYSSSAPSLFSHSLFAHHYCSHSHFCPVRGSLLSDASLLFATRFFPRRHSCPAVFGPRMPFDIRFEGPENVQFLPRTSWGGRRRTTSFESAMTFVSQHTHVLTVKTVFGGFSAPVSPFSGQKIQHTRRLQ
uniref:(northern house mosquito) hypothetical protein n=1 Tax=Culex pipiens TaxID=7175 RepID=A0A8D8GUS7_CULPI